MGKMKPARWRVTNRPRHTIQMAGVISPCGRFWGTPSPRLKINRVSPLVNNGSRAGLLASPKEGETGQN